MPKTLVQNAQIDFKNQLAQLKNITGYDDEEIAKLLGCSLRTVTNLRNAPFSVSGRYILMVQAYLKKEETKRWI